MSIQMHESLFYQTIDTKSRMVALNKKHIVSAIQMGKTDVEVKMSTGEIFHIMPDFGDLLFQLSQIVHKSDD